MFLWYGTLKTGGGLDQLVQDIHTKHTHDIVLKIKLDIEIYRIEIKIELDKPRSSRYKTARLSKRLKTLLQC